MLKTEHKIDEPSIQELLLNDEIKNNLQVTVQYRIQLSILM